MDQPIAQKVRMSPKDFFLHLGLIVSLYVSAVSVLNLIFETVNRAFPDRLDLYADPYAGTIRFAIASLLIIFPLYLFVSWYLNRELHAAPEKASLAIRRWLVYLTLFLAGASVAVDLIVLVNTFLGGEITTRFILKVLAVLLVAGAIFSFYLYDLRRDIRTAGRAARGFAIGSIIFVLAAIVLGFLIMGSPAAARKLRFDDERTGNLQSIQWQIINFWQQKGRIPRNLSELEDPISGYHVPSDPDTRAAYSYTPLAPRQFKLCADFGRESAAFSAAGAKAYPSPALYAPSDRLQNDSWQHAAGTVCFERTIDPELYPPRKK